MHREVVYTVEWPVETVAKFMAKFSTRATRTVPLGTEKQWIFELLHVGFHEYYTLDIFAFFY